MPDSPEIRARVLEAFALGKTAEEVTRTVGVTSRTLRRWAAADRDFAEELAEARCRADDKVEARTLRLCLDPDPKHDALRIFWLKGRRPETYRHGTAPETSAGGLPPRLTIPDVDDRPPPPEDRCPAEAGDPIA